MTDSPNAITDIHAHILPDVDDGSTCMEETLAMAAAAVNSGVSTLICTPHSPPPQQAAAYAAHIDRQVRVLQRVLRQENLPLRVLPGMEILAGDATLSLLESGHLLTLNGSRYVLLEFEFFESPDYMTYHLHRLLERRFVPVVAHPERYAAVQENPLLAAEWRAAGCPIQLNKGSLPGRFGPQVQRAAIQLLNAGVVDAVASDAHGVDRRTTDFSAVTRWLADHSPTAAARLLCKTPQALVHDRPLGLDDGGEFRRRKDTLS